jgi:beta-glucosidase
MKRKLLSNFRILLISLVLLAGCATEKKTNIPTVEIGKHSAVTPAHRLDWWGLRHQQILERIKEGHVDLIFIGDSITHGWENKGSKIWDQYYGKRNAVNMGFGGDTTQHVLWRLEHGEIDGISPKVAVVMIGTNNSNGDDNTAEEIADGIKAICQTLRTKLPRTKILLMAIFPREHEPSPQREKNDKASQIASKIADGKMIHYININDKFLAEDGSLSKKIMPDYLHPNSKGYKIWAEAIEPELAKMMGEKK